MLAAAQAVIAFLEMFPNEGRAEILDRTKQQRSARGPQIPPIDALAEFVVERVAVAFGPLASHAQCELVVQNGNVEHAFEAAIFIIPDLNRRFRFVAIGWLGGDQIDHACRRVAAVERSLRSAQDFDAADVEEFLFEEMIAQERRIVEGDGHRRIGRHRNRLGADAADLDAVA